MEISPYLYDSKSVEDSRIFQSSIFFDSKGNFPVLETGKFHLLKLTHKFPIWQMFQGYQAKTRNVFAEAMVLPWDLLVTEKHVKNFAEHEIQFSHKRRKINQDSVEATNNISSSPNYLEFPCLIFNKTVNYRYTGTFRCNDKFVPGCKPQSRKVVLEFGSDSFHANKALDIGVFYLVKHQEGDKFSALRENYQANRAKIFINSGTNFWSLGLSSMDTVQNTNSTKRDNNLEINIFVPQNALTLLENDINPTVSLEEGLDALKQTTNYRLPEGVFTTFHGLVLAVHDAFPDSVFLPRFLRGNDKTCVHVLVDGHIVKLFGDLNKEACPIGFGRDMYATFHRILVLRGKNKYMMTPVSFITIDYTSLLNGKCSDEFNDTHATLGLKSVTSPNLALISDTLQLSELKTIRFCCRVVAAYVLVLEKNRSDTELLSSCHSMLSIFDIPFAGFVLDDGSSSCCCWADSERAAALLGLNSEEYSIKTFERSQGLKCLFNQHNRVVVKNYGTIFDSSCQDFTFSVGSDKLISSSNEYFLRRLIASASCSTLWNIVGDVMDQNATTWLEERLSEHDMRLPLMRHVWATSVRHMDMLAEARKIIQQLGE